LHENLQGFPGAATESGEKFSVIKKIPAKDFGEAEDEMPVGRLLEHIHAEPLPEFHDALLMAGRAEVAALAGKSQQVFVAAVFAFDTGYADRRSQDNGRSPFRYKAARSRTVWRSVRHRIERRFQNSPPRSGNNPNLAVVGAGMRLPAMSYRPHWIG